MRNTKSALCWIAGILKELSIPFEIAGGLAAKMYGAQRELADIDINISKDDFSRLLPRVREYLKFGPAWYKDQHWNLFMITLKYAGQDIDISALGQIQFFNRKTGKWEKFPDDLSGVQIMNFLGLDLPFIDKAKLISYKDKLRRGVDKKDVSGMLEHLED